MPQSLKRSDPLSSPVAVCVCVCVCVHVLCVYAGATGKDRSAGCLACIDLSGLAQSCTVHLTPAYASPDSLSLLSGTLEHFLHSSNGVFV